MQGRVGPRLLQPFYDVAKLLRKAPASVNTMDDTYMAVSYTHLDVYKRQTLVRWPRSGQL